MNIIQDVGPTAYRKHLTDGPIDDPLVITMPIDYCIVKWILVDTGTSANIFFMDNFSKMEIP